MEYSIDPITTEDCETILDIFNHYVENSFAAYPEAKLPREASEMLMEMSKGLPTGSIKDPNGQIVGFGLLRPHHPIPTFSRTAEVTYFLHPDYTGQGLGTKLLSFLESGAIGKGITSILASISSLNPDSIRFHRKNGFTECGRFKKVAQKKGRVFDTVWMQKALSIS